MTVSAFLGEPPLTENDKLIYRALLILSPSSINPVKSLPFGPPRPVPDNNESHARSMIIGQSFAIAFVIIITSLRLWVRKFKLNAWGLDDWVVIPGALACVAYLGVDLGQETKGCLGKHQWNCTYEEVYWYALLGQVNESMFYFCVFTIKASIAIANGRLTGFESKRWRIAYWFYLSIVLILLPLSVFLNMCACLPLPPSYSMIALGKLENPAIVKCIDVNALSLSIRGVHIATDWMLLTVPLIVIYRSDISLAKKGRLGFLFLIGAISSVASIVRDNIIDDKNADFMYDSYTLYTWDVLDIFFATIVASLPALNVMLDLMLDHVQKLVVNIDSKTFHLLSKKDGSYRISDPDRNLENSRFTMVTKDEVTVEMRDV